MATKTSTASSTKSTFDPAALFASLGEGFDVSVVRDQILDGIKQGNQATLEGVKSVVEAFGKFAPTTPVAPFAADAQKNALAGIEFVAALYAAQTEFATNLVKTLVPGA